MDAHALAVDVSLLGLLDVGIAQRLWSGNALCSMLYVLSFVALAVLCVCVRAYVRTCVCVCVCMCVCVCV